MTKALRSSWSLTRSFSHRNVIPSSKSRLLATSCCNWKEKRGTHSTVDDAEIQLFSTVKDWWNPQGPMKALHSMNTIRVPFVRDGLAQCSDEARTIKPLKDKKILDVGCGGGILSEGLARLGANVTGIDATKELIAIAIEHRNLDPKIEENKPEYHLTTIEEHAPKYKNYYDGVVASEVIEHVNNKEVFVKSCIEALKPDGRIFFTTPNRTRISQFASICVAEYVLNLLPRGTHQYEKFITPTELTFLLERNNCHVEAVYGTFYHFLSNTWEFVKTQQLMYALQAVSTEQVISGVVIIAKQKQAEGPATLYEVSEIIRSYNDSKKIIFIPNDVIDETLHYIAVKPSASISVLRQKVWHLLDLPDYCEETIILKSPDELEIPLTELRRGNEPQRPYFLEVWPRHRDANIVNTIMNYKNHDRISTTPTESIEDKKESLDKICNVSQASFSTEAMPLNKLRVSNEDFKKPNLSCKFSRSSLFKLNVKKSQDNFTNLLLKIQNDLSALSNKLSVLETKITT